MARGLVEAAHYTHEKNNVAACHLCPHECKIFENKHGICGVRVNKSGSLYSEIYGELTSLAVDPIEKKPLYHFFPGTNILSIGTRGCNLKCPFCQNWSISQELSVRTRFKDPKDLVKEVIDSNSIGLAYTYNEPSIWFEYVLECAQLIHKAGLKNVMVTNGYINEDPLEELLPFIDAMNIDLKAFKSDTYRLLLKGKLESVCKTIERVHDSKCLLELTTLIVTDMNDTLEEMQEIINYISGLDKDIPWHISRYYPQFKYNHNATNSDFIRLVYEAGKESLNYVYSGNLPPGFPGSDTICPACGEKLIERSGYWTRITGLKNGVCNLCNHETGIKQ